MPKSGCCKFNPGMARYLDASLSLTYCFDRGCCIHTRFTSVILDVSGYRKALAESLTSTHDLGYRLFKSDMRSQRMKLHFNMI